MGVERNRQDEKLARYVKECLSMEQDIQLLKQGLSRVSVAANGVASELDIELDALRKALKSEGVSPEVKRRIDAITATIRKMGEKSEQVSKNSFEAYQYVLDWVAPLCKQLELEHRQKKVADLIRQGADKKVVVSAMANLFAELVNEGATLANVAHTHTPSEAVKAKSVDLDENTTLNTVKQQDVSQLATDITLSHSVNMTLSELVNSLALPDDLTKTKTALEKVLLHPIKVDRVSELITTLANMVIQSFNLEQENFKKFLNTVTDKFYDINTFLGRRSRQEQQRIDKTSSLESSIQSNVESINGMFDSSLSIDELTTHISGHLEEINTAMQGFREDELKTTKESSWQINQLKLELHRMKTEADTLRTALTIQAQKAQKDSLTGIANRETYDHFIEQSVIRWQARKHPLILAVGDIDNFKMVNDNYGHLAGDEVLTTLAGRLQKGIRQTDFIARYGGEEFVFIFEDTKLKDVTSILNKLRMSCEATPVSYKNKHIEVTMSFGVYEFQADDTLECAFSRADQALYKAKSTGKNKVLIGGA